MTAPDEHHVFFAVLDFDDPRQVSLITGVEPDDVWVRGETFSDTVPDARRRESRWILSSNLDRFASHRDHFERLLYKLEPIAHTLPALREHYRCGLGVSQFFYMDEPGFYLPDELIGRYRELGLEVAFEQLAPGGTESDIPDVLPDILNLPEAD